MCMDTIHLQVDFKEFLKLLNYHHEETKILQIWKIYRYAIDTVNKSTSVKADITV
jgi:hypothetical protein